MWGLLAHSPSLSRVSVEKVASLSLPLLYRSAFSPDSLSPSFFSLTQASLPFLSVPFSPNVHVKAHVHTFAGPALRDTMAYTLSADGGWTLPVPIRVDAGAPETVLGRGTPPGVYDNEKRCSRTQSLCIVTKTVGAIRLDSHRGAARSHLTPQWRCGRTRPDGCLPSRCEPGRRANTPTRITPSESLSL